MTEPTQPTDAEISACILAANVKCVHPEAVTTIEIARAVLAKWGTPAGAGEVAYLHDDGYWTPAKTEAGRKLSDRLMCAGSPKVAVYLTPQPTRTQAGAVPLTQYRLLEARVDRIEAGDEFLQDDAQTWATDPYGTFVGALYGSALRAARRRIKGADHG